MDVCYPKVKTKGSLYGRKESTDLQLIEGFGQVPEPSTLTDVPQPEHTSD